MTNPTNFLNKSEEKTCLNCGKLGHYRKNCKNPVTSFGIICYKIEYNPQKKKHYPKYLLIKRKTTYQYIDYICGKYNENDIENMKIMFNNMSNEELDFIEKNNLKTCWNRFWGLNDITIYHDQYLSKFLKSYYKDQYITGNKTKQQLVRQSKINNALTNNVVNLWQFPKGRRQNNETPLQSAMREFQEETNVNQSDIVVSEDIQPINYLFKGTDEIKYKYVFYLANLSDSVSNKYHFIDHKTQKNKQFNKFQQQEIQDINWVNFKTLLQIFKNEDFFKKQLKTINKELIKRANENQ